MRPLSLLVDGFACYSRRVEIDFSGMDVFVITGPTGAGKTALVDAITYALYGDVPRGTKVNDLVAHNRDDMTVMLEFEADRRRYRVRRGVVAVRKTGRDGRERVQRQPSPAQLERLDPDGTWRPIGGGAREVDDEIRRVVGLDFDTFTRCVLLPQGRFQEFLAGNRNDRREILYELLGMDIYERVMRAANERAGQYEWHVREIEKNLAERYAGASEEALAENRRERAEAAGALEQTRAEHAAMTDAVELAGTVTAARTRQREANERLQGTAQELAAAEELARDGVSRLEELRAAEQRRREERDGLGYSPELHALLSELRAGASNIERLQGELATASARGDDTSAVEAAREALAEAWRAAEAAEAARAAAEAALEAARIADAAAHLRSVLEPGEPCPVCGAPVTALPAEAAAPNLRALEEGLAVARRTERDRGAAREAAGAALARAEEGLVRAREQAEQVAKTLGEAEEALRGRLPEGLEADPTTIAAAFQAQAAAAGEHERLSREVQALQKQLAELEPEVRRSEGRIIELRTTVEALERAAAEADREASEALARLRELAQRWEWSDVLAEVEARRSPRPRLELDRDGLGRRVEELAGTLTRLDAQAEQIRRDIETAARLRQEFESKGTLARVYRELGYLLQRNQFRDFVLDEALGVLAASASKHLEALYPRFSLQNEKSEFMVVDHWQADQARPATTLSGGETFVVSLALALALADSLPRLRSAVAASLESLFIDEGFGTLDAETLNTVIEALEALRAAERMVGIVTHVPELAHRIETRIEVSRSQSGSTVTVRGA